jgi:hypothetical protein
VVSEMPGQKSRGIEEFRPFDFPSQPIATTARATPNRTRSGMIPAPTMLPRSERLALAFVVVGIFGAYHTGVPDAIIDFKALVIHVC